MTSKKPDSKQMARSRLSLVSGLLGTAFLAPTMQSAFTAGAVAEPQAEGQKQRWEIKQIAWQGTRLAHIIKETLVGTALE